MSENIDKILAITDRMLNEIDGATGVTHDDGTCGCHEHLWIGAVADGETELQKVIVSLRDAADWLEEKLRQGWALAGPVREGTALLTYR